MVIQIFTDGSCHTQQKHGAWVAKIIYNSESIVLQGEENDTSHNRMELLAVINSLEWIKQNLPQSLITIYSDSQYVCDLPKRKEKLVSKDFTSNKGKTNQNTDLLKQFYMLNSNLSISYIKVKAHTKGTDFISINNKEVDMLSRKLLREYISKQ